MLMFQMGLFQGTYKALSWNNIWKKTTPTDDYKSISV